MIMPKKHLTAMPLLALSLACCSTSAQADSVTADWLSYTGGIFQAHFTDSSNNAINFGRGGAGAMKWKMISDDSEGALKLTGSHFYSFCIEFVEHINAGVSTYAVVEPEDAPQTNTHGEINYGTMSPENASLMEKWFGSFYNSDVLSDPIKAMAFQMGVWELVYEKDSDSVGKTHDDDKTSQTDGVFTVTPLWVKGGGSVTAVKEQVDTWFNDANWRNGPSTKLVALSSPTSQYKAKLQDQIVVAETPSPVAAVAGLIGLAGLSLRRRRQGC